MAAMKRFLMILGGIGAVFAGAPDARADAIYQCVEKDGTIRFVFNDKPAGLKCTPYRMERKDTAPKGAKCRVQRVRETVFHACEKDGITWYFNKPAPRARRQQAGTGGTSAARQGEPPASPRRVGEGASVAGDPPVLVAGITIPDGAPSPELADMDSRRMDGAYLRDIVMRAAAAQGIPPALLRAVIEVESGANPDVVSPAGAQGLMQLMPVTAGYLDVEDPFDPEQNVMAGARLLRMLSDRFHGDVRKTVAAYYAGANAVRRAGGIPTRSAESYVAKVMTRYQKYSNSQQ